MARAARRNPPGSGNREGGKAATTVKSAAGKTVRRTAGTTSSLARASAESQGLKLILSTVAEVFAELPRDQRIRATRNIRSLKFMLRQTFSAGPARSARPDEGMEQSEGAGLGETLSLAEGVARLDQFVTVRPLESWAGPVAGAGEITRSLGVPRSTLNNWRQHKAVIGLLKGERNLAYPLDQFVDARPLKGLADVLAVAPDERAAWLWLRQPHAALRGQTPLDALKRGQPDVVARVAERDFV
jgi:hypothetical protein